MVTVLAGLASHYTPKLFQSHSQSCRRAIQIRTLPLYRNCLLSLVWTTNYNCHLPKHFLWQFIRRQRIRHNIQMASMEYWVKTETYYYNKAQDNNDLSTARTVNHFRNFFRLIFFVDVSHYRELYAHTPRNTKPFSFCHNRPRFAPPLAQTICLDKGKNERSIAFCTQANRVRSRQSEAMYLMGRICINEIEWNWRQYLPLFRNVLYRVRFCMWTANGCNQHTYFVS